MAGRKLQGQGRAYSSDYDVEEVPAQSDVCGPLAARQVGAVQGKKLAVGHGWYAATHQAAVHPILYTRASKSGAITRCTKGLVATLDEP